MVAEVRSAAGAEGKYRDMLIRLMTRQIYAETATAEVFGQAIMAAPTWEEKRQLAVFTLEEAQHSQGLVVLLRDLGEDPEEIIAGRPPAGEFWAIDLTEWIDIAVFNFVVDRAGSHQIMEYRQSSYIPWADSQEVVLADEAEHYDTGIQVLKAFAKDPNQFAKFKVSFDRVLPNAVKRAFGRPGSAENEYCLEVGLKRHTHEQILNRYLDEMTGFMGSVGLAFPPMSIFDAAGVEMAESTKEIILSLQ
jgi:1,2-phenylacetyl-CoA epoxidase catalytic subunit